MSDGRIDTREPLIHQGQEEHVRDAEAFGAYRIRQKIEPRITNVLEEERFKEYRVMKEGLRFSLIAKQGPDGMQRFIFDKIARKVREDFIAAENDEEILPLLPPDMMLARKVATGQETLLKLHALEEMDPIEARDPPFRYKDDWVLPIYHGDLLVLLKLGEKVKVATILKNRKLFSVKDDGSGDGKTCLILKHRSEGRVFERFRLDDERFVGEKCAYYLDDRYLVSDTFMIHRAGDVYKVDVGLIGNLQASFLHVPSVVRRGEHVYLKGKQPGRLLAKEYDIEDLIRESPTAP